MIPLRAFTTCVGGELRNRRLRSDASGGGGDVSNSHATGQSSSAFAAASATTPATAAPSRVVGAYLGSTVGVLGVAACAAVLAASPPTQVGPMPVANTAGPTAVAAAPGPTDGSFTVSITVNASLADLNAGAVRGTWTCAARALPRAAANAEVARIHALGGLAAHDAYRAGLEYRAHYLNQLASVDFPVAQGAYSGSDTLRITVARDDLVDPATNHAIVEPAALFGCWLQLHDASGRGGPAYQSPAPGAKPAALLEVGVPPYVLGTATIPNI